MSRPGGRAHPTRSLAAAAGTDAAAILAKHRTYVGWDFNDGAAVAYKATGTYGSGGITRMQHGVARRTIVTRKDGSVFYESGFTGRLFWETTNGFVFPLVGDAAKRAISSDIIYNEGLSVLGGTVVRTATIDNQSTTVVRLNPPGGFPLDAYLADTGALVAAVIDPDGSPRTLHVLAYSDLPGGKRMISSWRWNEEKAVVTLEKIDSAANVTDDQLHPPPPTATWTFGQPANVPDHGYRRSRDRRGQGQRCAGSFRARHRRRRDRAQRRVCQ